MIRDRDVRVQLVPEDGASMWLRVTINTNNNTVTEYAPSLDGVHWDALISFPLRTEAPWRKWLRPRYWRLRIAAARGESA